ncbi:Sas10 C-terminal domain-containing protein [Trametes elegans]|nr:Sas10 C-terminal domain-containing protein [Trametes elegans]
MVRRRSGKGKAAHAKPRGVDRKDSKMRRWNTAADVPMDAEDQFHASRDKILLEGGDDGSSDDGDEDEVFALEGVSDDESGDEDEEEGGAQYEDGVDDIDEVHYAAAAASKKEKKKKGKGKKGKKDESSEEESPEESEEEEGWGTKKAAYYSSNAQEIDSEDEEANELEEQEAKRLQAKARDAMAEDDFGLADVAEGLPEADTLVDEPAEPAVQPLPQDKQALLRHLEKTNPEALALANDWDDVAHSLVKSQAKIAKLEAEKPSALGLSMMHLHQQALLTYATTLAFYLHLRASEKYAQRLDLLRSHPILPRLLQLKKSLATLEDLDFAASSDDEAGDDEEEGSDISGLSGSDAGLDSDELMADAEELWAGSKLKKKGRGLEHGELEELLREANDLIDTDDARAATSTKKAKRKQKPAPEEPPKKKRKAADTPVFDLVEPELDAAPTASAPSKRKRAKAASAGAGAGPDVDVDVYGEAAALDAADAADKQARRKSLRFHVARIEGTAARRAGARAGAIGGDDDIPYRERRREREARLAREVARARDRAASAGGAALDDVDPEAAEAGGRGRKRGRDESESESGSGSEGDGGDEDGYYQLVQRKSKEKKEKKKAEYEAARAAERYVGAEEGVDGPRSLTRAILKNKGLTPKRAKSVRNPRVKKRQKFEKAKKKVSSQRAVYKGGVDASRYGGEKTGISQTVKGVRLS